jgi:hypothetical protein
MKGVSEILSFKLNQLTALFIYKLITVVIIKVQRLKKFQHFRHNKVLMSITA